MIRICGYDVYVTWYFYEMKQPKKFGAVRLTQRDLEIYLGPLYIIISRDTSANKERENLKG